MVACINKTRQEAKEHLIQLISEGRHVCAGGACCSTGTNGKQIPWRSQRVPLPSGTFFNRDHLMGDFLDLS